MAKTTDERFLRLEEDGDKALVFFAGASYVRYVYWDGKQTREWWEDCGQKKNLRVAQNVILCHSADKKLEITGVKALEQGKRFFQNVSKRNCPPKFQNSLILFEFSFKDVYLVG